MTEGKAVLLLVYNRALQTEKVLTRLRECGVTNVFVSADGPKNSSDRHRTEEVKVVLNRFDSIIKNTRFSDKNLGCKNAVVAGINWFFDHVEEGIILEDDCLPSEHFFPFINDMLDRYRNEEKVWMISGNNQLGTWQAEGNHFFSRIGHIWGWATWKNRWKRFNPKLPGLNSFMLNNGFERSFGPTRLAQDRKQLTLRSLKGEIDTWDYQWMAHILMENGLAVVPSEDLVENIGFGSSGTNITEKPRWIRNEAASEPLQISERPMVIDREYEMELELCRRSNSNANRSAFNYSRMGRSSQQKLKIVLMNSTDVGGGAEKVALNLHRELLERGHESNLLVQQKKSDSDSVQELRPNSLEQLKKLKPDVIHVHNLHGTTLKLSQLAILSQEIPVVFTLHDSWLTTGSFDHPFVLNGTDLSLLESLKWKTELADRREAIGQSKIRFTVPSQWLRERFLRTYNIKAHFVPNAIGKREPTTTEVPSQRYILFVANNAETNPYKDLETLKAAWTKANSELKERIVDLVCVSGAAANETYGTGQLIILPKRTNSEILALMKNALFVVQASKQDNSPLTILEAHSVGKAVVASAVGGIPEMLSENELKFAFEPENRPQLKEKLVEAVRDFDKGNLKYSNSELPSFDEVVDAYLGHYLEMVNA